MPYCTGTTPGKTPGYNYEHACKLEAGHDGDCVCIGCGKTFPPNPPLPVKLVRVVPPEEIDPARSLLAKDYMRWNGSGPSSLKERCKGVQWHGAAAGAGLAGRRGVHAESALR